MDTKKKREVGYICRRMLGVELPGRRKRRRPKRFLDMAKDDMQLVCVTDDRRQGEMEMEELPFTSKEKKRKKKNR